jgi:hypothetical protein
VGQHHALRPVGGARGVHQKGEVAAAELDLRGRCLRRRGARLLHAEGGLDDVGAVVHEQGDAVAVADPAGGERAGEPVAAPIELGEAPRLLTEVERGALGPGHGAAPEHLGNGRRN